MTVLKLRSKTGSIFFMSVPIRCVLALAGLAAALPGAVLDANPLNYRALLRTLKAGDTLSLASGKYRGITDRKPERHAGGLDYHHRPSIRPGGRD